MRQFLTSHTFSFRSKTHSSHHLILGGIALILLLGGGLLWFTGEAQKNQTAESTHVAGKIVLPLTIPPLKN